jgi:hypothetical protein
MGKVPGKPFSYSDHEGVEATLSVEKKDKKGKAILVYTVFI